MRVMRLVLAAVLTLAVSAAAHAQGSFFTSLSGTVVDNSGGVGRGIAFAQLDDTEIVRRPLRVLLSNDGRIHHLRIRLG